MLDLHKKTAVTLQDPQQGSRVREHTLLQIDQWDRGHLCNLHKNKTPLQAVKTRDGKEMVEALLMEFERRGEDTNPPLDPALVEELRERLGLM